MNTEKITAKRIKQDLRRAFDFKKNWIKEAQDDFMFALGKMWEDKDKEELRQKGVLALTINKIKPNIKLLTGIESQNRSDILCYPEGKESGIVAEIATALVKNVWKTSGLNYKRSEQFKYGIICGESFLEPWIDYSQDMINGDMRWKRNAHNTVFFEPGFEEYDGSDAGYAVKVTFGLRRGQILSLFPDKEKYLDKVATSNGSILGFEGMGELKDELGLSIQKHNYNDSVTGSSTGSPGNTNLIQEPRYDLVEYYFKKYVKKFYVIRFQYDAAGKAIDAEIKEVQTAEEMNQIAEAANLKAMQGQPAIKTLTRYVAEIWRASMIGEADDLIEDETMAPTYPRWQSFPFIPYYADRFVLPMKDANTHLLVQGIVRDMKSLNLEYNKRRTQELRILNSSANSGFVVEENSLVEESKWEKYGSSPGVLLKVKQGKMGSWQKIEPTSLSQGHAQLAAEGSADMKESSGINAEQLALETGDKSGRAIALKQKQGLVMVQNYFDNLSQTSRLLGKFILSHLGEVFDVPEAIHVLGDQFISDNFSEPVLEMRLDATQGGAMAQMPKVGPDGKLVMQVNKQRVAETFQKVLDDAKLGKFEVAVGETISNETMKYANYMVLMDMAKQGLPIPPEVIIDESMLSVSSKEKIKSFIEQQMAAQAQAQPTPQKGGK